MSSLDHVFGSALVAAAAAACALIVIAVAAAWWVDRPSRSRRLDQAVATAIAGTETTWRPAAGHARTVSRRAASVTALLAAFALAAAVVVTVASSAQASPSNGYTFDARTGTVTAPAHHPSLWLQVYDATSNRQTRVAIAALLENARTATAAPSTYAGLCAFQWDVTSVRQAVVFFPDGAGSRGWVAGQRVQSGPCTSPTTSTGSTPSPSTTASPMSGSPTTTSTPTTGTATTSPTTSPPTSTTSTATSSPIVTTSGSTTTLSSSGTTSLATSQTASPSPSTTRPLSVSSGGSTPSSTPSPAAPTSPAQSSPAASSLPSTGSADLGLLALALLGVVGGSVLLASSKRRPRP